MNADLRRGCRQLLRIDGDRPGICDAVKEDETQDSAPYLLIGEHDVGELVESASLVAGRQPDA